MARKKTKNKVVSILIACLVFSLLTVLVGLKLLLNPDTANWNSYKSSQFSYSFKYPPSWNVYSPSPDGNYEGNLNIVSNSGQNNLLLVETSSVEHSIPFDEKAKNYQYWDWQNKKSKIININNQKTFWMTGIEDGKKQEVWLIEGKNHYFEFRTVLDYDSRVINSIINSFDSF